MANINISANIIDDLFTIILDESEWIDLYINGIPQQAINREGIRYLYQQDKPAALHFKATVDKSIGRCELGTLICLKGPGHSTYVCMISYEETKNEITLSGLLVKIPTAIPHAFSNAQSFSQGKMTGLFEY